MSTRERPLSVEHQIALSRSITAALHKIRAARAEWIAHVEKYGECYCQNPFRAHVDNAEDWVRFHIGACAANQFWIDAAAERHKATPVQGEAGPAKAGRSESDPR